MAAPISTAAEIRKLRKKLRQIENLERLARPLDDFEKLKVSKKYDIRDRLQELLDAEEDEAISREPTGDSNSTLWSWSAQDVGQQDQDASSVGDSDASFPSIPASPTLPAGEGKGEGEKFDEPMSPRVEKLDPVKDQHKSEQKVDKSSKKAKRLKVDVALASSDSCTESPSPGRDTLKAERSRWEKTSVVVSELDGHSDLVTCVNTQGTTLVSASRDTTVKVWDLEKGEEMCSLGGHTETVTSVLILSPEETAALSEEADLKAGDSYIISGSTDCTFKLWSLKTGQLVRSVYTFSPVTCLDYSSSLHLLVTASDGGKIELWDVKSATNVCSTCPHEDSVTAVKVQKNTVISAGSDGLVMVHEIRAGSLVRVFVSEDIKLSSGSGVVQQRAIRSLTVSGHTVVYGDDAPNIKLLDWKKGVVSKVVNHINEFASTDALYLWDDLLLSSSFDLDHGSGYINVRSFSRGDYLGSLDDEAVEGTERIVCLTCTRLRSGNTVIVSGGPQLKVWELLPPNQSAPQDTDEKWVIVTQFLPPLSQPARDSEAESDADDTDDDEEEGESDEDDEGGNDSETSWLSWCSLL